MEAKTENTENSCSGTIEIIENKFPISLEECINRESKKWTPVEIINKTKYEESNPIFGTSPVNGIENNFFHIQSTNYPKKDVDPKVCENSLLTEADNSISPCSNNLAQIVEMETTKNGIKNKKHYPCPICGKNFARSNSRKKHLGLHFLNRSIVCSFCGRIFIQQKHYLIHNFIHAVKKKRTKWPTVEYVNKSMPDDSISIKTETIKPTFEFDCDICGERFDTEDRLQNHLKTHPILFNCDICSKSFSRKSSLTQHKLIHFGPQFYCEICSKPFKSKSNRNRHLLTHSQTRNLFFKCTACVQKFNKSTSFVNHWITHQEKAKLQCKLCNKTFNKTRDIFEHCKNHFYIKNRLQCEICPTWFIQKKQHQNHLKMHAQGIPPGICCTYCLENYTNDDELSKHTEIHEKPFQCGICLLLFKEYSQLCQHIEKHTDKHTNINCPFCTATFHTDYLADHIENKHSDMKEGGTKKSFTCNYCSMFFTTESDLKNHLAEGSRKACCKICSIDICSLENLIKHIRETHIGAKNPFACVICTREYADKDGLVNHLLSEQGNDLLDYFKQCEICHWNFFDEGDFTTHWKQYHQSVISDFNDYKDISDSNIIVKEEDFKDEFDIIYQALEIKEDKVEYSGYFDLC
ncbi:zinc finger protein 888-like [Diorhabda sublineata]|uniref:zinc finger protein 888-like n=1 Tax=Diorhabda sublineata TaxID=1163346 RepID=UPI0024E09316|nr:zinc finger protein 888-like [Diorhabda sublineata]XP_056642982.1 zinc finger protein 888-like [Diorhabda sublineata]